MAQDLGLIGVYTVRPQAVSGGGGGGGLSIENAQTTSGTYITTTQIASYAVTDADVLFVGVHTGYSGLGPEVDDVTFNSSSFTSTTSLINSWPGCQLFYLNGPSGTGTIEVTMAFQYDQLFVGAFGVVNGNGASLGTLATSTGTTASPSLTVASATGEIVIGIISSEDNNGVTTSDNAIYSGVVGGDVSCAAAWQDGATSVELNWGSPNVEFVASGLSVPEV